MRVGVFDSGVGGLSVLKSLLDSHAFEEIIYFGDTARVPYGVKDPDTIRRYSLEALQFLQEFDVDVMVLACNTASAHALKSLQQVANIDVIGVIEPGVLALQNRLKSFDSPILVIGTKATIASNQYATMLRTRGYTNVRSLATGLLIPLVEEGIFSGALMDEMLRYYFDSLSENPKAIILGCTHFPLIAPAISRYFSHSPLLIHSGEAIMQYLRERYVLEYFKDTKVQYFASENSGALELRAREWLLLPSLSQRELV
ncbi:MAG: glutamate racemase [Wolinella sp.]